MYKPMYVLRNLSGSQDAKRLWELQKDPARFVGHFGHVRGTLGLPCSSFLGLLRFFGKGC